MGNRAVLTFSTSKTAPAIYLHWNGGRASVEGFLDAARALGLRHATNPTATMDRLAGMLARHFFGTDVGMTVYREEFGRTDADNYDNGTYILAPDLTIKSRMHTRHGEEINQEKTREIFERLTAAAPAFND